MKAKKWIQAVLFFAALGAGMAMAAEAPARATASGAAEKLEKSSVTPAVMGDKEGCPVDKGGKGVMHKSDEPCPYMNHAGKMHEGCDVQARKDCLEKNGEPCKSRRDKSAMSKQHEACDPAKMTSKPKS